MTLVEDLRIVGGDDDPFFFARVVAIAVDDAGRIFVVEQSQHKVFVFNESGEFVGEFGKFGEGPGDFTLPSGIAFGTDGHTYVVDQSQISLFDSKQTFVRSFRHERPGCLSSGFIVAPDGSVFVSCFDPFEKTMVHKYDREGRHVVSFGESYAGKNEDPRIEQTYAVANIAANSDGNIWLSQQTPLLIRKYSPDGELLMNVHRDNGFVKPPVVKVNGETYEFYFGTASYGFGLLPDGTLINSIIFAANEKKNHPWPSFIDLFTPDGTLSGSVGMDPVSLFECSDKAGRLYFMVRGDDIAVSRCRLVGR